MQTGWPDPDLLNSVDFAAVSFATLSAINAYAAFPGSIPAIMNLSAK